MKRQQPNDTDVTFGSIPTKVSRSHFSVDSNKLAAVSNLKKQWKKLNCSQVSNLSKMTAPSSLKTNTKLQLPQHNNRGAKKGPIISLASIMSSVSNSTVKKIRIKSSCSSRQASASPSESSEIPKNKRIAATTMSQQKSKQALTVVTRLLAQRRDTSLGSEESNGPPPRFNRGLISIKYKKSPIRLVSPPMLKKEGDSGSQSMIVQ